MMLGAAAGDLIGSVYEWAPASGADFEPLVGPHARFTDDTVLTVATAHALLTGGDYAAAYRTFGNRHPRAGYGGSFRQWLATPGAGPYGSWGNGSAMRVSPVGWAIDDERDVLAEAERSAAVTHDHPFAVAAAQAVALSILRARRGAAREEIRAELADRFGYRLGRTVDEIRPGYRFDVSAAGSVPEAIVAFLDSADLEGAVRLAVSLGGDADTQAAIAGSIAEAFYGGVGPLERVVIDRLPDDLRPTVLAFRERFVAPRAAPPERGCAARGPESGGAPESAGS